MKDELMQLMHARQDAGLVSLPLTLAFQTGVGREDHPLAGVERPASLCALYPDNWPTERRQLLLWHRTERDDDLRNCCEVCGTPEHLMRGGRTQVMHMDWDAANLSAGNLVPGCPNCHREWDKGQQDAGATLTRAGEGTLDHATYRQRLIDLRADVAAYGLIRLGPDRVDLAVAAALQEGPCTVDALPQRLTRWFPMVSRAVLTQSSAPELTGSEALSLVISNSLLRLGMRRHDVTLVPYVARTRNTVRLTLGRLHLDPSITVAPHSRWTAPRYVQRRAG